MAWTETARRDHARRGLRYSSDLTDEEWALIKPFLPDPRPLGRPRTTDLRDVVNAILYLVSSGCATGIGHIDNAIRTARAFSSDMTGQIAIGLISSIAGSFLADLRTHFRAEFPNVEQIVMEGPSTQTVAMVRDGKLDLALVVRSGAMRPTAIPVCCGANAI